MNDKMAYTYCHICLKKLADNISLKEARRLAVLHMRMTPHILVFGYDENTIDFPFGEPIEKSNPKPENNPERPPKKWWDKMYLRVKRNNPDYTDKQIRETVGDIWHNKLSKEKKREILRREID